MVVFKEKLKVQTKTTPICMCAEIKGFQKHSLGIRLCPVCLITQVDWWVAMGVMGLKQTSEGMMGLSQKHNTPIIMKKRFPCKPFSGTQTSVVYLEIQEDAHCKEKLTAEVSTLFYNLESRTLHLSRCTCLKRLTALSRS